MQSDFRTRQPITEKRQFQSLKSSNTKIMNLSVLILETQFSRRSPVLLSRSGSVRVRLSTQKREKSLFVILKQTPATCHRSVAYGTRNTESLRSRIRSTKSAMRIIQIVQDRLPKIFWSFLWVNLRSAFRPDWSCLVEVRRFRSQL